MTSYHTEYSTTGRAKCKLKKCGLIINKNELRICKRTANDFFAEGGSSSDWYHASCFFLHMKRAKKHKLEKLEDLEGYEHLADSEQKLVKDFFTGKIEAAPFKDTPQYGQDTDAPSTPPKKDSKKDSKKTIPASFLAPSPSPPPTKKDPKKYIRLALWDGKVLTLKKKLNILGRASSDLPISDKKCAHRQVEITITQQEITIRSLGKNPTFLFRDGLLDKSHAKTLKTGMTATLHNQDLFYLALDKFPCRVTIVTPQVKEKKAPAEGGVVNLAKKKKKKSVSSEEEDNLPDEYDLNDSFIDNNPYPVSVSHHKKKKGKHDSDDDSDYEDLIRDAQNFTQRVDNEMIKQGKYPSKPAYQLRNRNGLPPCQYGAACYRKNPNHFAEYWHPPKQSSQFEEEFDDDDDDDFEERENYHQPQKHVQKHHHKPEKTKKESGIAKKKSKLEDLLDEEEDEINRAIEESRKLEENKKKETPSKKEQTSVVEHLKTLFQHLPSDDIVKAWKLCGEDEEKTVDYLLQNQ